ncbi:MAG: hypothetical protein ACLFUV_01725 [Methanomassiliicoccales archaeon]
MPRCPFCKRFAYTEDTGYVCDCGEELPGGLPMYRRERRRCGKTIEPLTLSRSAIPSPWGTD